MWFLPGMCWPVGQTYPATAPLSGTETAEYLLEKGCVKAMQGEEEITIACDTVVMAVGSGKNVLDVEGVTVPAYHAGDCSGDRTASISEAVRSGYMAANEI